MSSRNSRLLRGALAAAALGAMLPLLGTAGTVARDPSAPDAAPARAPAVDPGSLYELRCWQYGRLLFEERVALAGDAVADATWRGTDAAGKPVIVSGTGNATCLLRGAGRSAARSR